MFEKYMTHSERTTVVRKLVKICSFPLRVIMIVEADPEAKLCTLVLILSSKTGY